jgi:hypothetical protein
MDMQSFHGARQYQRISFTDSSRYYFKSGLYIYRANHGQFNTIWGRNDVGYPGIHIYNRKAIMDPEDQRKIARFYFTAFLEATLQNKTEYVPFFQDYRTARDWLPETIYLNQFEDSETRYLCDFEEDLDVSSATWPDLKIYSDHLTVWREELVPLKWGTHDTRAVYLGWNTGETDSIPGRYRIESDTGLSVDSTAFLVFALADANESSNPKEETSGDVTETDSLEQEVANMPESPPDDTRSEDAKKDAEEQKEPLDFSIMLTDGSGQSAVVALHHFSYLQPQLKSRIMKADFLSKESTSEIVFQHFRFPIRAFTRANPMIDLEEIRQIDLIFDRSEEGVVVLDNLGLAANYQ